jgi:hypothetical protein
MVHRCLDPGTQLLNDTVGESFGDSYLPLCETRVAAAFLPGNSFFELLYMKTSYDASAPIPARPSAYSARIPRPYPFAACCVCHVYGTPKPNRGGELSVRHSRWSVVRSSGRLTEYSGLCERRQRERRSNRILQNLHECQLLSNRYLSFRLPSGK